MGYLILAMREGSGYADSPDRYEFPSRYLDQFTRALADGEIIAIIYEPRREGGRQAFVAWARITSPPTPVPTRGMFEVTFDGGLRSFDRIVPFVAGDVPVEHRLRELPRSRWGPAVQGASVRPLSEANALEILVRGTQGDAGYSFDEPEDWIVAEAPSRTRRMVARIERAAAFRDMVLRNYEFRCAVTGLGAGPNPASRLNGLLDVAHIQPVSDRGPDTPGNGIVLTPTVHRLFDAGLFTMVARRGELTIRRSPALAESLIRSPRGSRIVIEDGAPLSFPSSAGPSREFLEYHRNRIFVASAR